MASRRAATALVLARENWTRISWMVGEYPNRARYSLIQAHVSACLSVIGFVGMV
jgi:hypothetical protein